MQSTNIASASVPDLRARQPVFKLLIGLGILAIIGAIVIAVVSLKTGDDPGRLACERVEELAKEHPDYWDRWNDALVRTVIERAWNSKDQKYVAISKSASRYERCTTAFEVIRDTISYGKYTSLSDCVSKMTNWREGSSCFETF